jgi:hypothetical protein
VGQGELGQGGHGALDDHAGEPVQPDHLDHAPDLGLRAPDAYQPAGAAQAPCDDRQVQEERAVGERQVAKIDDEVALDGKSAGEGPAAPPPRRDVLVPRAVQ